MSKYENMMNYTVNMKSPLMDGEELIWSGTPKKSAFVMNKVLFMMPIALIWLALDLGFMIPIFSSEFSNMSFFFIPFFALHLFPVWIWLSNVITANRRWKNTKYYVTDKRIIIQSGFIDANYHSIFYKDIKNVNLRVSLIDKVLKVGDIYFDLGMVVSTNNGTQVVTQAFLDIDNPYEVYPKIQKVVLDIQTDIEYPNALRPDENNGYNTKYRP